MVAYTLLNHVRCKKKKKKKKHNLSILDFAVIFILRSFRKNSNFHFSTQSLRICEIRTYRMTTVIPENEERKLDFDEVNLIPEEPKSKKKGNLVKFNKKFSNKKAQGLKKNKKTLDKASLAREQEHSESDNNESSN